MGKRQHLNSKELITQALENVKEDRAMASTLLIELMSVIKNDETKHQYSGPVAAKYLETLQRSNEQMVKLASLLAKKENVSSGLSSLEKSEIYDLIKEE